MFCCIFPDSLSKINCYKYIIRIHIRGNGTCQLSSEIIDATRSRPIGTIFDPDFDIYARRNNCFSDPQVPQPGGEYPL